MMRRRPFASTPIHTGFVAAILALLLTACAPPDEPTGGGVDSRAARDSILGAAQSVVDAVTDEDPELLRSAVRDNALIVSAGTDRLPAVSTVDQLADALANPPQDFVERMWDPRVRSDGTVAQVWAPYDFYRDGELSHCGTNTFQLVHVNGRWRVQGIVYSHLQPPACETHPDGPPGSD